MWRNFVNGTPMARQGFWIGSFCKIYNYTERRPRSKNQEEKWAKISQKGVFFPAPPTSWMSLAETVWHSLSFGSNFVGTVSAWPQLWQHSFRLKLGRHSLSQTHPSVRRSRKKTFFGGFLIDFLPVFCFFTDYLYMKMIF